jgi:large subunit ribosomal protein L7Ae
MAKGKQSKSKKVQKKADRKKNPLFEKRPRNYRIGNAVQHKRDLTRFVRWPRYILL